MERKIGQLAPDFSLPDQNGNAHKLSDYAGQWVVLYFYPQDDTPGCTTEACAMRDNLPDLQKIRCSRARRQRGFSGVTQAICRQKSTKLYHFGRQG